MIAVALFVFIANKKLLFCNIMAITLPIIYFAVMIFLVVFLSNVKIWYYHIDEGITEVSFYIIFISCLFNIANYVEGVKLKTIFIKLIFPGLIGCAGYTFSELYLSNRYKVASGSEKYLIRLVYYPLVLEVSLILQEFCFRTFDGGINTRNNGRAHFLFITQVSFGVLGRYMTIASGCLIDVTVFSAFHSIKDVLVHRLSRLQCYIAYKVKWFFGMKDVEEDFDTWFYNPAFQEFRAHVFNNDFLLEMTGEIEHFHLFSTASKAAVFGVILVRIWRDNTPYSV